MAGKIKFVPFFPGQREDEKVIWIIHQHWWTLAYPLSKGLVVFLISLFLPLWKAFGHFLFGNSYLVFIYLCWLIFWASYTIYKYMVWQANRTVITSERLVDFNVKSMAHKEMREVALDQIAEITYVVRGWGATFFRFGSIIVRSGLGELPLDFVPHPEEVQSQLAVLVKEATKDPPVTVDELVDFIKEHRL